MLLSKSVCCDKVVKCHDICAAPMSLAFIVGLSQQCVLTFIFDGLSRQCRDILSSFFLLFCRDNHFYVATFFQCFLSNSSNPLSLHIFEFRNNVLLSFALFFVVTKL